MKTFSYLLVTILLAANNGIKSQQINPLDFFPHHVGDLWQYITYTQVGSEFTQLQITSVDTSYIDSSINITKFNGLQEFYFKIYFSDTLTIYQNTPGGWGILYDLSAEINSFWISDPYFPYYTKYMDEYVAEVFGDSIVTREYWTGPDTLFILPYFTDHSALGIGYYYGEFEVGITVLNGCIINGVQYGTIVNANEKKEANFPTKFELSQNYPNPFNPKTNIKYSIPERGYVTIKVYDVLGNTIKTLVSEEKSSGIYEIEFDATRLSSGAYYYRISAGNFSETKKMLLIK